MLIRQSRSLIPKEMNFCSSRCCGFYALNIYYLPYMEVYIPFYFLVFRTARSGLCQNVRVILLLMSVD